MGSILPLITFILLSSTTGWAAEGHASGDVWSAFFYKLINFVILVSLLYWAVRKPAVEFFRSRALALRESVEGSRRVYDEALENNRIIRKKIDNIEKETSDVYASYIDSGKAESKKILEQATITSNKIRDDVQKVAQIELKKAKEELRETAIVLARELAEKEIKQELNDTDNARLYQSYVRRMKEIS